MLEARTGHASAVSRYQTAPLSAVLMRAQVTAADHACLVAGRLRVVRGLRRVVSRPQMFQREALRLMCRSWRPKARAAALWFEEERDAELGKGEVGDGHASEGGEEQERQGLEPE